MSHWLSLGYIKATEAPQGWDWPGVPQPLGVRVGPHCLEEKGVHTRFLPKAGPKPDLPLLPGPALRGSSHLTESSI